MDGFALQKVPSAVVFGFWVKLVALWGDTRVMGTEHLQLYVLDCSSINESLRDGEKEEKSPLGIQTSNCSSQELPW